MADQLPKFHETFIPILKVLSDGKVLRVNELRTRVRDEFYGQLPSELLSQKTKSGDFLILNRIAWGKSFLKQADIISQPERAFVQITDKGRRILQEGKLTLKDVLLDPDFIANRKSDKEEGQGAEVAMDSTPQDLIDSGFSAIENQIRVELLSQLKKTDPYYFQKVVLVLLERMGYGAPTETPKSNDGGIDGIITQDKLGLDKIYMQAKRYADNQVGGRDMTNFIGALSRDNVDRGIFVATSSFSNSARENASKSRSNIILIDGDMLVELMLKFNVGVQIKNIYEVKEVDHDFFEEE